MEDKLVKRVDGLPEGIFLDMHKNLWTFPIDRKGTSSSGGAPRAF
jgi:hypothetical protein